MYQKLKDALMKAISLQPQDAWFVAAESDTNECEADMKSVKKNKKKSDGLYRPHLFHLCQYG